MRLTLSVAFLICLAGLTHGLPTPVPPPAEAPAAPPNKPVEPPTEQELSRQRYEALVVEMHLFDLEVARNHQRAAEWDAKIARHEWEDEKLKQDYEYAGFRRLAINLNRSVNEWVRETIGVRLPAPAVSLPRLKWPREPDAPQKIQDAWRDLDNIELKSILLEIRREYNLVYYKVTGKWLHTPQWMYDIPCRVKADE